MNRRNPPPQVVAIAAATDWYTMYEGEDGRNFYLPMAVWAMREDGDFSGIDVDGEGGTSFAEEDRNFIGYYYRPDFRNKPESEVPQMSNSAGISPPHEGGSHPRSLWEGSHED